jgi:hypothetical protein
VDGQPVLGADLNRSESRWPASVPKTAQVKTGNAQNKQMLSALPPLATEERTFRIGRFGRVEDGRGSLGHSATLRFPSPLIEPDVPD